MHRNTDPGLKYSIQSMWPTGGGQRVKMQAPQVTGQAGQVD